MAVMRAAAVALAAGVLLIASGCGSSQSPTTATPACGASWNASASAAAPKEGIALTHFTVSEDVERSRRFYTVCSGARP